MQMRVFFYPRLLSRDCGLFLLIMWPPDSLGNDTSLSLLVELVSNAYGGTEVGELASS